MQRGAIEQSRRNDTYVIDGNVIDKNIYKVVKTMMVIVMTKNLFIANLEKQGIFSMNYKGKIKAPKANI